MSNGVHGLPSQTEEEIRVSGLFNELFALARQAVAGGSGCEVEGALREAIRRLYPERNRPAVVLGSDRRSAVVLDVWKPLSPERFKLIETLLGAGDEGWTKTKFLGECGDHFKTLRTMRNSDAHWARVILMPGPGRGRYRIAQRRSDVAGLSPT